MNLVLTVRVRYFGVLSAYAGAPAQACKQQDVCLLEGTTVQQLFLRLAETGSASLRSILLQEGKLNPVLRVVRNQTQVEGQGFQLPLADGDEILILTSIAGG